MTVLERWRRRGGLFDQMRFAFDPHGTIQRERIMRLETEVESLRQQHRGAVDLLRNARLILSDHGQEDGDNCVECREMVAEIDAHIGGR